MTPVPPDTGAKVLVTGANGYIAIWIVRVLLERGYIVRGTVRSAKKAEHVHGTFKFYGEKFSTAIVEDITQDGAFDEAVKGMDAIIHAASPFTLKIDDPKEVIGPAVHGTTTLINSAIKNGPSVKRIVVTSSVAAVVHIADQPTTFTEKDWNEQALAEVESKGRDAAAMQKYRASKTLAERAAWDIANSTDSNGHRHGWDLVTLQPPFVFGPTIHEVGGDASSLNTSMLELYNAVVAGTKDGAALNVTNAWIDVRDLALAHQLALASPDAGGQRIIISSGSFRWHEWLDAAQAMQSEVDVRLPPVNAGLVKDTGPYHIVYDTTKAGKVLALGTEHPYKKKEETLRDCLVDFKRRGW